MVVPAARFTQQANKIKELENQVKNHQRERVLIYDAAMKQVRLGVQQFSSRLDKVVNAQFRYLGTVSMVCSALLLTFFSGSSKSFPMLD